MIRPADFFPEYFKVLECSPQCSELSQFWVHCRECFRTKFFLPYVNAVDVFITNKYLQGTFTSCSKVSVPSLGRLAIDLMCGAWGASKCTPEKWFEYMGDSELNPYVPFKINYNATDTKIGSFTPLDPKITPCNQALNQENLPACSCIDCESGCPVPPPASSTKTIDLS